ncbi:MAG: hypothetical protein A3F10_05655 [Coxiella sp. RIFCSPHIGHO2_12_FULL_42_15]|nr:MAG: hypothetical protein A3F10_05655 [Coxiella sp. RIFCSPHIGHO2_12_FULL_42_15]
MPYLGLAPVAPSNVFTNFMNGMSQGEALRQTHQANQLNQLRLQYLPQEQHARLSLLRQQAQLLPQMQQQKLQQPLSSFGRLMQDRQQAISLYGKNSPQIKAFDAALQKATEMSNGTQVYGPKGELLFSQGGPSIGNYFKNPMMGSHYGGAGGTFFNPQTGQAISTDTTPMTTSDQTAVSAVQRVTPQINNIMQKLPQFQSGWKNLSTNLQGVSNRWLGSHFSAPSERASGLASLETAPEALLKAYGLRPSEYALHVMKKTIEPHPGETGDGYRQRILDTLNQLNEFQDQSTTRLREGIPLEPISHKSALLAEIARRKKSGIWK